MKRPHLRSVALAGVAGFLVAGAAFATSATFQYPKSHTLDGNLAGNENPLATQEPTEAPGVLEPTDAPATSEAAEPTGAPEATETAEPTESPEPTETAEPTRPPEATETPEPTETAEPTDRPERTESPEAGNDGPQAGQHRAHGPSGQQGGDGQGGDGQGGGGQQGGGSGQGGD
jgi:outer membrane biosynthesis protein TonB